MEVNPVVCIIVPVFNAEKFLSKCIESILRQSFKNIQIILVNDGSTDGSGIICNQYARIDKRIKVIHQQNNGQSYARNAGINAAKSDYISFIDADDYIAPDMVETLYNLSTAYNADITECCYKIVYNDREEPCEFGNGIEFGEGEFMINKFLKADIFYGVVTKFFKASVFNGLRFPQGRIYEDTLMTLSLCLKRLKYVRTEDQLYYYFQSENSTLRSRTGGRKAREFIYILENQIDLVNQEVADQRLRRLLLKRINEKSVVWYLGLALSEDKNMRIIYSRLYLRRFKYSILKCLMSNNISLRNKISYSLCKIGFGHILRLAKDSFSFL
jgi:glycosyltransferase involved in cell wall biosynthesis